MRDTTVTIDLEELRRALTRDLLVIDAGWDRDAMHWRLVLALDGARYRLVALDALRDALVVLQRLDPRTALDLTLIDPTDATVELRLALAPGELGQLALEGLDARALRGLLARYEPARKAS